MALTSRGLAAIKPGEWQSDPARKGAGRLVAFGMKSGGVAFYFRYSTPQGARDSLPIGRYDASGRSGLTLQQASDKAATLSKRFQSGDRNLRAILEAEERERSRRDREANEAMQAESAKKKATLGALLMAYVEQLRRDGKTSAKSVELAIDRHIKSAWPDLWNTPADRITPDDLLSVVARIADEGKLREAAKLRSYVRAAYAAGIQARQSARSIQALRDLRITTNPARDLVTIDGAANARDRALSLAELRAYWKHISDLPDPDGALLRFHLLTGGQRAEQLARLTVRDLDRDTCTVVLHDTKGRRRRPRVHVIPLTSAATAAMDAMRGDLGYFIFTLTRGLSAASYAVLQRRVRDLAEVMIEEGESTSLFTPGDLRRTVETRLAAAGVSADIRAQLQSHGLGGIQARHYDRHSYLDEKRAALETLHTLVSTTGATITPIARAKARKKSDARR